MVLKIARCLLLALPVFSFCLKKNAPETAGFRLPPEFAPAAAVWLLWPNVEHKKGFENRAVTRELARLILTEAEVRMVFRDDSTAAAARSYLGDSIFQNPRFQGFVLPFQEFWARDMGPIFTVSPAGKMAVADFDFNTWDYGDTSDALVRLDEKLDEKIAARLGLPLVSSPMVHESGDHEINSQGVLLAVEAVEKQRNPGMGLAAMEAEFRRLLGATRIVWLKEGLVEDESTFDGPLRDQNGQPVYTLLTTNGHIDEFARFAADSTILLAEVAPEDLASGDPFAAENARRLDLNFQILKAARNADGRPFRIVRIPLPLPILADFGPEDPVYELISELKFRDGSVFPKGQKIRGVAAASYCNFLIVNNLVIAPKYANAAADSPASRREAQVAEILASVFPRKKIVFVDALSVNFCGGGIHCISMQEPRKRAAE